MTSSQPELEQLREEALHVLMKRRDAFNHSFDGELGKLTLKDLRDFCGYDRILFGDSARDHAFFEGQRSVYLHIVAVMTASNEDLRQLVQPAEASSDGRESL